MAQRIARRLFFRPRAYLSFEIVIFQAIFRFFVYFEKHLNPNGTLAETPGTFTKSVEFKNTLGKFKRPLTMFKNKTNSKNTGTNVKCKKTNANTKKKIKGETLNFKIVRESF